MVQIPIYNLRRATEQAQPGYRQRLSADPRAFGAGLAKGIQDVGAGLEAVAAKAQADHEQAVFEDARFRAIETRQRHEQAFQGLEGQNALAGSIKAPDEYGREMEQISASISSDSVRLKFEQLWARDLLGFQRSVDHHTARESDAMAERSYRSLRQLLPQRAAQHAASGDIGALLEGRQDAVDTANGYADRHGMEPIARKAEVKRAASEFHASALQSFLANDQWDMAKKYLANNREEIEPGALERAGQAIERASVEQKSTEAVDKLVAKHGKGRFELDMVGAREDIKDRAVFDGNPRLRQATEDRLEEIGRQRRLARQEWDGDRLAQIEVDLASKSIRRVSASPLYDQMSPHGQALALRLERSARRARRNPDGAARNDRTLKYLWKAQPYTQRLEADPMEFGKHGSPEFRAWAMAEKRNEKEGAGQRPAEFNRTVSAMAVRNGMVGPRNSTKGRNALRFKGFMRDQWDQWKDQNPDAGYPSQDTIEEWEVRAFEEVTTHEGWLWDTEQERYLAETDPDREPEEGGDIASTVAPPTKAAPSLRWPKSPKTARSIDDVPTDAVVEIMRVWRKERGPDANPNEWQLVAAFNKLQAQR